MQRTAGVADVKVSLNDGLTILDLKPGNAITLAQLRKIIKDNGFVSKEARVAARGTVAAHGADLVFVVSGTNETFLLTLAATRRTVFDELQRRTRSGPVPVEELRGTATAATGLSSASLAVEAVR